MKQTRPFDWFQLPLVGVGLLALLMSSSFAVGAGSVQPKVVDSKPPLTLDQAGDASVISNVRLWLERLGRLDHMERPKPEFSLLQSQSDER